MLIELELDAETNLLDALLASLFGIQLAAQSRLEATLQVEGAGGSHRPLIVHTDLGIDLLIEVIVHSTSTITFRLAPFLRL